MSTKDRVWIGYAAWGCAAAALLHIAAIIAGPDWFDFLGAPPSYGESLRQGNWQHPVFTTLGIVLILLIWAAYAFAALGRFTWLPLKKFVLAAVAAIFILRGALGIPIVIWVMTQTALSVFNVFHLGASVFVLTLGYGFWRAFRVLQK